LRNENVFVGMVLFNSCALIVWEWFAAQGREWMRGRWVPRLLALTVGTVVTELAIYFILHNHYASEWGYFALYLIVMAGMYGGYRYRIPDLFMLAGIALSLIVVATTGLARVLLENSTWKSFGIFLLLGLFSMLATAAAAWWLRQLARELKGRLPAEVREEAAP
jgi:uncharacterized membrane protein